MALFLHAVPRRIRPIDRRMSAIFSAAVAKYSPYFFAAKGGRLRVGSASRYVQVHWRLVTDCVPNSVPQSSQQLRKLMKENSTPVADRHARASELISREGQRHRLVSDMATYFHIIDRFIYTRCSVKEAHSIRRLFWTLFDNAELPSYWNGPTLDLQRGARRG